MVFSGKRTPRGTPAKRLLQFQLKRNCSSLLYLIDQLITDGRLDKSGSEQPRRCSVHTIMV